MSSDRLEHLIKTHAVSYGDFVLASGAKSTFYIDIRQVALRAEGAILIGELFFGIIEETYADAKGVGGLTLGADPLIAATIVAAASKRPGFSGLIVRKESKSHGTTKQIEIGGDVTPGDKIVVVDDVITTAGSTIQAIDKLEAAGYHVVAALCVVDREAGGEEALAARGIPLHALFKQSAVVDA